MNDGGYELPKRLLVSQALCAGIGKSSEFERHLAEEGIEVIAFDPTVRELPHPHRSIKFVKLWLKGDSASDTQSISILGAFSLLDPDSLKLIKLDIEGDEIDVLDSLSRIQGLERVQILVIEFHNVWEILDKDIRERWGRVIMFLRENFDCVVFNANNWTDFFNVGTLFCPETFEVTLVNKNFPKKTGMGTGKNLKTTNRKDWLGIPNKIFLVNESSD
jgi:hypothetical protein